MLIIWRGWGILVPLFAFIAFVAAVAATNPVEHQFGLTQNVTTAASFAVAGVLAGLALFLTARKIESKKARVLVDPATNQRVVFRTSAGSFFFIPTRYWAFITPALGLAMAVMGMLPKSPL